MLHYQGAELQFLVDYYDECTASQPTEYVRTDDPNGGLSWMTPSADRSILLLATEARDREVVVVTLGAH